MVKCVHICHNDTPERKRFKLNYSTYLKISQSNVKHSCISNIDHNAPGSWQHNYCCMHKAGEVFGSVHTRSLTWQAADGKLYRNVDLSIFRCFLEFFIQTQIWSCAKFNSKRKNTCFYQQRLKKGEMLMKGTINRASFDAYYP